jgi:hypothetical protein
VLIALLLGWLFLGGHGGGDLWFFGGRTPHQMSAEVDKVVPDKEVQNATKYNLSLIERDYKSLESQRAKLKKDVLAALERHDTTIEQFHTFETRADAINVSATKNILDVRFLMREQLSEAQWRSLFPPPATPQAGE